MARRRRNRGGYGGRNEVNENGFFGGVEMQLRIEGVTGDSDLPGHEGWIPILAWSFGMSRNVDNPQLPTRVKQSKIEKKKAYFAKHGFDMHGQPLQNKDEEPKQLSREERQTLREKFEELSEAYEEDDEVDFQESELPPRKAPKANLQDFSLTKYVDRTSAKIYSMVLGAKKGVDCTLRVLKARAKPKSDEEKAREEEEKRAKDGKVDTKSRGQIFDDNNDEDAAEQAVPEKVYVIQQSYHLTDCFISSCSTGGSGGEDRLTENVTINFTGLQFTINDLEGKYALLREAEALAAAAPSSSSSSSSAPKPSTAAYERSIIYDPLRNIVSPYKEAVQAELTENDQLRPVNSLVLGYL